jgi:hypothetical protein
MMSEQAIDEAIRAIDEKLARGPDGQNVSMGVELFTALMRRGLVGDLLPAPSDGGDEAERTTYRETHPAFVDPQLADDAFSVGRDS